MKISFEATRTDFLNYNKYMYRKKRLKRSLAISLVFVIIWTIILNTKEPNILSIVIEFFVFSAFWAVYYLIVYTIHFHRIKKMPDKNGSILGHKTYIIEEDGLKEIAEMSESFTKWVGIKNIDETKDYIYIFVDKIAAFVIPKRCFSNESECQNFTNEIKSKISEQPSITN